MYNRDKQVGNACHRCLLSRCHDVRAARIRAGSEIRIWPGCYFEDFRVGDRLVTAGRTITDGDLALFVGLSGNAACVHVDEVHARSLGHTGRVVHGLLTLAVVSGLLERTGIARETVVAQLGLDQVRFVAPVFVGDTIRAK